MSLHRRSATASRFPTLRTIDPLKYPHVHLYAMRRIGKAWAVDILFVGLVLLFFVVTWGLVKLVEQL